MNTNVSVAPAFAVRGLSRTFRIGGGFFGAGRELRAVDNVNLEVARGEVLAIVGLGLGPVGLAFYVWDYGVKNGDIKLLGVASYAAPVLSTQILVAAGFAPATASLGLACALIVGGAVVASRRA